MKPTSRRLHVLSALTLAVLAPSAGAATKTYEGPNNGNFATAANWSPAGAPTSADDASIGTFDPVGVTGNLTVTLNSTITANSITLNSAALPSFAVLNETTGGALSTNTENVGNAVADNIFNQNGNSTNQTDTLNIGIASNANTYNISGVNTSLQVFNGGFNIGVSGTGLFTQSGGTVSTTDCNLTLGVNAGSAGTYTLSNGTLSMGGETGELQIGNAGTATFTQTGGSSSFISAVVGSTSGTAAFNFAGGTIISDSSIFVSTNGTFNLQSGGVLTVVVDAQTGGFLNVVGGTFGAGGGVTLQGGTFQLQGNSVTVASLNGLSGTVQNGALLAATLTLNSSGPNDFRGVLKDGPSGILALTLAAGSLSLQGANTYSGPTLIQSGLLQATLSAALSPNSTFTLTGGALDAGATTETLLSLSGTAGTVNILTGGSLSVGANNANTTYAGAFTGSGTFTKIGTGTLTLSGTGSTFAGNFVLQTGNLTISALNALPLGANFSFSGTSATLNLAASQSFAGFSAGNLNPTLFSNSAAVLTIGSGNVDTFIGGNFSGAGTLVKSGFANLTIGFGATDTVPSTDASLTTIVNSGILFLNKAPGTSAIPGPLQITGGSVILNASNQIADSSSVNLAGGTLNLNGFNETIAALSGPSGNIALNGGTLTVAQSTNGSTDAALTGTGIFIKTGLANLSLTDTFNYNGSVTSDAGRLILSNNANAGVFVTDSGGTIQFNSASVNVPGVQIIANAGGTFEYFSSVIFNAFLRGPGTHVILPGPTSNFVGVTTFNSTTITQNGPANFDNFTNGGTINSNANLDFDGGTNNTSGIINVNNIFTTQDFTNNGVINIAAGASLTSSLGNLFLGGGARMYIGTTAAPGGTLTLAPGTTLEVNGALLVNDGTISGTTDVNFGGTAQGTGTYGPVNVTFGGTFQPGFASASLPTNGAIITALSGNGTIDNTSAGPMILTLAGNSASTFSGPIQNSNGITALSITGTTSLTLSTTPLPAGGNSINTYTGGTSIAPGGSLIIAATGALPAGGPITNNGNFTVNANSTAGRISGLGALTLGPATTLHLAPNSGASKQASLTLNTNAQLDLTNNPLIIEAPDPITKSTDITHLAAEVATARNGGLWTGPGITSATVAADPTHLSIAVADNSLLGYTTYGGQPVDANSILIVPAFFGDANLDGHVDLTDLSTILNNFGTTTGAWTSGNFDGNPTIDLTDLSDVLNNFGASNPNASDTLPIPTPTPEPASLALFALSFYALLARTRR